MENKELRTCLNHDFNHAHHASKHWYGSDGGDRYVMRIKPTRESITDYPVPNVVNKLDYVRVYRKTITGLMFEYWKLSYSMIAGEARLFPRCYSRKVFSSQDEAENYIKDLPFEKIECGPRVMGITSV